MAALNAYLKSFSPRPDFNALDRSGVVKHVNNNGVYSMSIDGTEERYKLFGRGITYASQNNSHNPWDPNTSDGATRNAIRYWDYQQTVK